MIRYIIWDAGGTLFDTYPSVVHAFLLTLDDLGVEETVSQDWVDSLARTSIGHCAQVLAETFKLDSDVLYARFRDEYDQIPAEEQTLFPGVTELCEYILASGGMNFIATHRWRSSLIQLLETHQIRHYFEDFVTKDAGYPRKPDPTSLNVIIDRHNLARSSVLAIGDREIDILAGQAAGICTCYFGTEVDVAGADCKVTTLSQLLEILKQDEEKNCP